MKKHFLPLIALLISAAAYAQTSGVGINTITPATTLEVKGNPDNNAIADGIIAPIITGQKLKDKDGVYLFDQQGAIVYVSDPTGSDSGSTAVPAPKTVNVDAPGYYYFEWTGDPATGTGKWMKIGSGNGGESWFYLPSFNLDISTIGTAQQIDLYNDVYKKQFTQTGNPVFVVSDNSSFSTPITATNKLLYSATQLVYVVTYYDSTVIDITSINDNGVMFYDVLSTDATPNSFINIVCVVK